MSSDAVECKSKSTPLWITLRSFVNRVSESRVALHLSHADRNLLLSAKISTFRTAYFLFERNTLSGEIFVRRNYSLGEIFVTKRNIRHFCATKNFAYQK